MIVSRSNKHAVGDLSLDSKDSPSENEITTYGMHYGGANTVTDWIPFSFGNCVLFFNSNQTPVFYNKIYYKKNFKTCPPGTVVSFIQE